MAATTSVSDGFEKLMEAAPKGRQNFMPNEKSAQAVIRVGDGRGFVVEGHDGRQYVITAAHCLRSLPEPNAAYDSEANTYSNLLARLHAEPAVSAVCRSVDPVSDIAVLGSPDDQECDLGAEDYRSLVGAIPRLAVRKCTEDEPVWLLGLDGQWFRAQRRHAIVTPGICLEELGQPIAPGMSGSPILGDDGKALGVVCLGPNDAAAGNQHGINGPHANLAEHLPVWLFNRLFRKRPRRKAPAK
jgi:hypothetical protein